MLSNWINHTQREKNDTDKFVVTDIGEICEPTEEIKQYLCEGIKCDRFPVGFLEACISELGWSQELLNGEIILPKLPKKSKLRRGEFGEIFTIRILEQFFGYKIPVTKLRYKLSEGQSLPATDALAFRLSQEGEITEISLVETKLRTVRDKGAAANAQLQLSNDYSLHVPNIFRFVAERLYETDKSLFSLFGKYLRERKDNRDKDSFTLSLWWDESTWNESVLTELQESDITLSPLTVHVIRVKNLRLLTDEIFRLIGIEVSDED